MALKIRFTDTRFSKIQPPKKGREFYYDTQQPKLRLQVTPKGTLSFQMYSWDPTRQKPVRHTLGRYPAMGISKARKEAAELLSKVQSGVDIEEHRRQLRSEMTLNEALIIWLKTHVKVHRSEKYYIESERTYNRHVKPAFGKKQVGEIHRDVVAVWHRKLTDKPKRRGKGTLAPATANRCLALVRSIYSITMPHLDNPAAGVKQFREKSRDRFLHPDELKRFFKAVDEEPNRDIAEFVLVALYTGARRSNVLAMKWANVDFDLGTWTIPADESKNREPMLVPLLLPVTTILTRRKKSTRGPFVFPSYGKTGHLAEPKEGWKRIIARARLEDVRIHDLRRTMGSYQTITGASTAVVGKTLGHKNQQSTAVYARLNLDPVRESMEQAVTAMQRSGDVADDNENEVSGDAKIISLKERLGK